VRDTREGSKDDSFHRRRRRKSWGAESDGSTDGGDLRKLGSELFGFALRKREMAQQ